MKPYDLKKLKLELEQAKKEKQDSPRFLRKQKKHIPNCFDFVTREMTKHEHYVSNMKRWWDDSVVKVRPLTVEACVLRYNKLHRTKVRVEDIKKLLVLQ